MSVAASTVAAIEAEAAQGYPATPEKRLSDTFDAWEHPEAEAFQKAQRRDDWRRVEPERVDPYTRVRPLNPRDADTYYFSYDAPAGTDVEEPPRSSVAGVVEELTREESDVYYLVFGELDSMREAGARLRVSHMKVHRTVQRIVERARFLLESTILGDVLER